MGTSTSSTDHAQERNGDERSTSRAPLHALTSLRFLAAMAVVLYHYVVFFAPAPAAHTEHTWWWLIASSVFPLGVDFFFVLSGFILAYTHISMSGELRGSRANFWIARFARIYPVFLLGLALDLIPYFLRHHSMLGTLTTLVATPLLLHAWFPTVSGATSWNPPGWSLSDEAFFYLLFPFVAVALAYVSSRRLALAALGSCALFVVAPLLLIVVGSHPGQPVAWWIDFIIQFNPLLHLPEFIVGLVLGLLHVRGDMPRFTSQQANVLIVGSVIAIFLLPIVAIGRVPPSFPTGALVVPFIALLIAVVAQHRGLGAQALSQPRLVWLGEISYGVYIFHWPLWSWVAFAALGAHLSSQTLLLLPIYLALLILISGLSFRYLETPARRTIRARWVLTDRPRREAQLAAASIPPLDRAQVEGQ